MVIATDIDEALVADSRRCPASPPARLDVTRDDDVRKFVEEDGAVDILFNCAGWVHQGSHRRVPPRGLGPQLRDQRAQHVHDVQAHGAAHDRRGRRRDPQHGERAGRREGRAQSPRLRREQGRRGGIHARARHRPREAEDPRELRVPRHRRHARRSPIASTRSPIPRRPARTSSRARPWGASPPPKRSPRPSSTSCRTNRRS